MSLFVEMEKVNAVYCEGLDEPELLLLSNQTSNSKKTMYESVMQAWETRLYRLTFLCVISFFVSNRIT